MQIIVSKMQTLLVEPDYVVIQNLKSGDDEMFLIAKGECMARVLDDNEDDYLSDSEEEQDAEHAPKKPMSNEPRILRPGHIFGEIAVLFGCERSAQATAAKYSTLAVLNRAAIKEIHLEIPEFKDSLM